jgi:hypothetical protein
MRDAHFLCRPIVFDAPERAVHPPSWLDYTPFAFWIVDALRPRVFVELGCQSGNSYASVAQAVHTLGLSTACYAVDTWTGDPHSGVFDESVFDEWSRYHDRRFASFSRLIRSTFDAALQHFADGSIDLLHIDGYHTADAVAHDFEAWRPKLSERAVVLFHDIGVREQDFGAWRVWERLRNEYPSFEFRHGYGLGVLGVGRDLSEAVRWLMAVDGDDAMLVRRFFSRLGAAVLAEFSTGEAHRALREERARRSEPISACGTADGEPEPPTIVVVSHVGAWQPRAGNEYRLNRMLHWYRRRGYRVLPIIAPLAGEALPPEAIRATADAFGNVIQVHRDGRLDHALRDAPASLHIPKRIDLRLASAVDADADGAPAAPELLKIDRTFCHDALVATVLHVQQSLGPHILQVEYIWMTRLFPLMRPDVLRVVDTVDVFSNIQQKVAIFGVRDVAIHPRDEAHRLRRADLIIAIQEEERQVLRRLARGVPLVTAGVDFDVAPDAGGEIDGRILCVGSGNPRNGKGLRDFVQLAWPRIRQRVPHAELVVVGSVARALAGRQSAGVTALGAADELTQLYRDAALVINPVVAGTGVKVKTLEALSHLRPVVTWPAGVDGLDPRLAARCVVAHDWYEFAHLVVDALTGNRATRFGAEDRAIIAELVTPHAIYRDLDAAYAAFFEQHGLTRSAAVSNETATSSVVTHVD